MATTSATRPAPAGAWTRPIHDDHTRIIQMDEATLAQLARPVERRDEAPALRPRWRPRTAFLLSVIPGLGHLYRGAPWAGLAWFLITALAYLAWPPLGTACHILGAVHAMAADPWGL